MISRFKFLTYTFLISYNLISFQSFGQEDAWNKQISRDGIIVYSKISNQHKENGKEIQLIEYKAIAETEISLESCFHIMKDVSTHKYFLTSTKESSIIKMVSPQEFYIYYYFNTPWPLPDTDCISHMKYTINEDQSFTFEGIAAPELIENKGVKRIILNDVNYTFRELDNGSTEISMSAKFFFVFDAPIWMIQAWFPSGPAGILRRFIELTQNK